MESLFVREAGNPTGQPVVFLHGGPLSSKMWQPQFERLADMRCLAPDLPGHGQSHSIPFSLKESARLVADLIRRETPTGSANIVGLSLGGAVALTLLREYPEVIDRVMVSGTAARLGKFTGQFSLMTVGVLKFISAEKQAEMTLRQLNVPEAYYDLVYDDLVNGGTETYSRSMIVALMSMDLPQSITCPLLVAVGERETMPARQAARKLLQLYLSSQGVIVPRLNHLWNLQDPDLFSATVRAWVTNQPLPEALRLTRTSV